MSRSCIFPVPRTREWVTSRLGRFKRELQFSFGEPVFRRSKVHGLNIWFDGAPLGRVGLGVWKSRKKSPLMSRLHAAKVEEGLFLGRSETR